MLLDAVYRALVEGRANGDESQRRRLVLQLAELGVAQARLAEPLDVLQVRPVAVIGMDERVQVAVLELEGELERMRTPTWANSRRIRAPWETSPPWLFAISKMNSRRRGGLAM